MAATVQAQYANGAGPTLANAEGGLKYNREDTLTGTTPIPIPTSTGVNFSWLKCLALVVTGTGTTNMSNRRVAIGATETTGLGEFWTGQKNYTQSNSTVGNAGGNVPTAATVTLANLTFATTPTQMPQMAISGTINQMVTSVAPGNSPVSSVTLANSGNNVGTNVHQSQWLILDPGTANAEAIQVHLTTAPTGTTITFNTTTTKNHNTTNTPIALACQRATTSNAQWDNTSVATSSAAQNGDFCQMVCGVGSDYVGGAGNAIALSGANNTILLTYDEA